LVGLAFVLPSFIMVVVLAMLYIQFDGLGWMQGAFYGIGAAVIAIIAKSSTKLMRLTLQKDRLLWALFLVTGVVTAWTESEIVWLLVASGVVVMLVRAPPRPSSVAAAAWPMVFLTGLQGSATADTLLSILMFFGAAGSFVFGSGLAIVPFLYGGVVQEHHWLTDQQFLDAVAVAMITPGPVVITVGFIGYLVGGLAGAALAATGTFLPCYLLTVLPAKYFRRFAQNPQINAFVGGVTAAATGAIGALRWCWAGVRSWTYPRW
jgi:chromate transporter